MKRRSTIAILSLSLSLLAAGAQAEFVVESMYRETSAYVMDVPLPQGRTSDGEGMMGWGNAVLAATAIRDDSIAQASEDTEASWSGSAITIAGTYQADLVRTGSGDQDALSTRNLITMRFDKPETFILHLDWEKSGYPGTWVVRIDDLVLGDGLIDVVADDEPGSLDIACSGSGVYRLVAEYIQGRVLSVPGERSGGLSFTISLAPEGPIPTVEETWSGVKALYR
ncbi:MAG: hypothetical protein R6X35_15975 [Candidatus Krumholzibacteriia bacterium]